MAAARSMRVAVPELVAASAIRMLRETSTRIATTLSLAPVA
jgi:hypothetical protein